MASIITFTTVLEVTRKDTQLLAKACLRKAVADEIFCEIVCSKKIASCLKKKTSTGNKMTLHGLFRIFSTSLNSSGYELNLQKLSMYLCNDNSCVLSSLRPMMLSRTQPYSMYQPFVKHPVYNPEKLDELIESGEAKKREFTPIRAARNDQNVSVFHDELTR